MRRRLAAELDDTGIFAAALSTEITATEELITKLGGDPDPDAADHVHAFIHDDNGGFWGYQPVPEHLATRNEDLGRWEALRSDVAHLLPS